MSKSYLLGVDKNLKNLQTLKEYQNSWGTFPAVWLQKTGMILPNEKGFKELDEKMDRHIDNKEYDEALIIYHTYYPVFIHRSCFDLLKKAFNLIWEREKEKDTKVNHYKTLADDIDNIDKRIEYITIKGTSVDDLYEFWHEKKEKPITDVFKALNPNGEICSFENGKLVFRELKDFKHYKKKVGKNEKI